MEIREAQASDIDSLLRLNYQIGIMHFENAPEAFVEPSFEEKEFLLNALNDQSRLFLVAEVSGIGTQLMAKCSDWAKSQGAEQIKLEVMAFNGHAQKFYTKLGFAEQSKTLWKTVS
ncbi:GNAT family N-acetyltransferase [Vibrio parahaemolyticus]